MYLSKPLKQEFKRAVVMNRKHALKMNWEILPGQNSLILLCSLSVDQIFPISASKLFGRDQMIRAQGSDWRVSWLQLQCRLCSETRSHCFSNIASI
jgi:hypothetical protein